MAALLFAPLSGGGSLVDLDATFFIQLGLFFFMFIFLYALLFRPAVRLIEARRQATDGTRAEAGEMREEAARLEADVEAQIRDIRAAAQGERDRIVEQARRREREQLDAARAEARRSVEQARERMEQEGMRARADLEAEVEKLAATVAERALGRSVAS